MKIPDYFFIMFHPESNTKSELFGMFLGRPFEVEPELRKGVTASNDHWRKFQTLLNLANRLLPGLALDNKDLNTTGHTPAIRSAEFTAVSESMICELYGALDGIRRALFSIYGGRIAGIQNSSTSKLFQRAHENFYVPPLPKPITQALAGAYESWFKRLRLLRSELTHGENGSCHLDRETKKISYMHKGITFKGRIFHEEDFVSVMNSFSTEVRKVLDAVYGHLYHELEQIQTDLPCVMVGTGRILLRRVGPERELNSGSGICKFWKSFPGEEFPCRVKNECTAYKRAEGQNFDFANEIKK